MQAFTSTSPAMDRVVRELFRMFGASRDQSRIHPPGNVAGALPRISAQLLHIVSPRPQARGHRYFESRQDPFSTTTTGTAANKTNTATADITSV